MTLEQHGQEICVDNGPQQWHDVCRDRPSPRPKVLSHLGDGSACQFSWMLASNPLNSSEGVQSEGWGIVKILLGLGRNLLKFFRLGMANRRTSSATTRSTSSRPPRTLNPSSLTDSPGELVSLGSSSISNWFGMPSAASPTLLGEAYRVEHHLLQPPRSVVVHAYLRRVL
eukprot:4518359-Amphidinium_carterae.1